MKLFSLGKQVQITYHIHLSNFTKITFLNAPIKNTQELFQIWSSKILKNLKVQQNNRLSISLPRNVLLILCKSFVRPHLDCDDILYNKLNIEIFRTNKKKFSIEPALQ